MIQSLKAEKVEIVNRFQNLEAKKERILLLKRVFGYFKNNREEVKFLRGAERSIESWSRKRRLRACFSALIADNHQKWKNEKLPATLASYRTSLESRFLLKWKVTFE